MKKVRDILEKSDFSISKAMKGKVKMKSHFFFYFQRKRS